MTKTLDVTKLAKLCTLFSSSSRKQVLAAVRQADALVKASGHTWCDVFGVDAEDVGVVDEGILEPVSGILETIDNYFDYEVWFNDSEVEFLENIRQVVAAGIELNDQQRTHLETIRQVVATIDERYSDDNKVD